MKPKTKPPESPRSYFWHRRVMIVESGVTKSVSSKGGITLCIYYEPVDGHKYMLSSHYALCNWKDTYNKKIGRLISEGKALSRPYSRLVYKNTTDFSDAIAEMYHQLEVIANRQWAYRQTLLRGKQEQVLEKLKKQLDVKYTLM